jgi:tetratricopeptide (TPR) repeat protein
VAPRARVLGTVALAAAALATVAVGGAVVQGRGYETQGEAHRPTEPPALELSVFGSDEAARALRAGERAYERGDAAEAIARFESAARMQPTSVEAAVGQALASWPDGTTERLGELAEEHPRSGVVRLHLGLALAAEGDEERAAQAWRDAERFDPDSPAALEAETLLHPEMPRGRPYFIAERRGGARLDHLTVAERLRTLRVRARSGGANAWIAYGAALQRVGRSVSARVAFDRAVALAPASVEARTAAAVARFDKDDPAAAFSRLGPLARSNTRSPVVRFHLGFLLLWLGQVDEAKRQLALAVDAAPRSVHGREAERLLASLAR